MTGRSKRDELKRKMAQASLHAANAVLDLNYVHDQFKQWEKPEAEILEKVMILIAQSREVILQFADQAWGLDEEHLQNYL